ncbi:hypothetical protein MTR67_043624 [Solanum verrucosum]|uniref:Uncharacterized protein n=1 Tax=Solanum verrucosum TaxID=315347 RepID=A0AAF0ZVB4_SOLVR|nr:hypothetical protein MTR67_043624 [Solanum verrucosum]
MLNANAKRRWKRSKGGSQSGSASPTYFTDRTFVAYFRRL